MMGPRSQVNASNHNDLGYHMLPTIYKKLRKKQKSLRERTLNKNFVRYVSSLYRCAFCGKHSAPHRCSGCRHARYCGKTCQIKHWSAGGHKSYCKKISVNEFLN